MHYCSLRFMILHYVTANCLKQNVKSDKTKIQHKWIASELLYSILLCINFVNNYPIVTIYPNGLNCKTEENNICNDFTFHIYGLYVGFFGVLICGLWRNKKWLSDDIQRRSN